MQQPPTGPPPRYESSVENNTQYQQPVYFQQNGAVPFAQPYPQQTLAPFPPAKGYDPNMQQQQVAMNNIPVAIPVANHGPSMVRGFSWHNQLFSCCRPNCVVAFCCPFYLWGITTHSMGYFPNMYTPMIVFGVLWIFMNWYYAYSPAWTWIRLLSMFLLTALGAFYRGKIREQYGITGTSCEDYCTHLCCRCCAILQEHDQVVAMKLQRIAPLNNAPVLMGAPPVAQPQY